jgi:hypothetical protein
MLARPEVAAFVVVLFWLPVGWEFDELVVALDEEALPRTATDEAVDDEDELVLKLTSLDNGLSSAEVLKALTAK